MTGSATVKTTSGPVQGTVQDGVLTFKAIPYGASTAGANRFLAPQLPKPWTDVRNATQFAPACPQPVMGGDGPGLAPELMEIMAMGATEMTYDEDCLTLNVWSQATDGAPRPVMVWFHGGGWTLGTANTAPYDGTRLARRGDVVIVSVNHRLGALGYLALEGVPGATEADVAHAGCAGALDMVASLQWVRDNIAAFGGDPGNVTIFGESGGGAKVSVLMAMPAAEGLFHKAIAQSGPMIRAVTRDEAAATTKAIMEKLSVETLSELRSVAPDRLIAAQVEVLGGALGGFGSPHKLAPVLDPVDLPVHPFDPTAAATAASVALLVGTCRDEMTLFLTAMPGIDDLSFEALPTVAGMTLGAQAAELVDVYRRTRPEASASRVLAALWTDKAMGVASIQLAERKLAGGTAPVFMYRLDYTTPVLGGKLGAPHALDLGFVFDNLHTDGLHGQRPGAQHLADAMSSAWIAFARSGDPSHPGLPVWPSYDTTRRATMIFDETSVVVDDPDASEREAWEGHPLGL